MLLGSQSGLPFEYQLYKYLRIKDSSCFSSSLESFHVESESSLKSIEMRLESESLTRVPISVVYSVLFGTQLTLLF